MIRGAYRIVSENTEDRLDEADTLDEAVRIARTLVGEGQDDDPVSVEYEGRVIHQFVRTAGDVVDAAAPAARSMPVGSLVVPNRALQQTVAPKAGPPLLS